MSIGWFDRLVSRMAWWRERPKADAAADAFARRFGFRFRDPELLEIALTHRSSLTPDGSMVSNERLEFLGDSVLGLVVTDSLFESMSDADEGILTKARSRVVNKSVLGKIGIEKGLLDCLNYARDEIKQDERALLSLSADALEAVIGAVYLDVGYDEAFRFVKRHVIEPLSQESSGHVEVDYKSKLQEISQARFRTHPQYKVVKRMGPEHRKIFHVEVMVRGRTCGFGTGRSKKEAEQQAAGQAVQRLEASGARNKGD